MTSFSPQSLQRPGGGVAVGVAHGEAHGLAITTDASPDQVAEAIVLSGENQGPSGRRHPPGGPRALPRLPSSVKLLRPDGASPRLIEFIGGTEQFLNAALKVVQRNNPRRAPEYKPGPAVKPLLGEGNAVEQYWSARGELQKKLSGLRVQNREVRDITNEVKEIVHEAHVQLLVEVGVANGVLRAFHRRYKNGDKIDSRVEVAVFHALAFAIERGQKALVDSMDALKKVAEKVDDVRRR
jgi:hypothetical protein